MSESDPTGYGDSPDTTDGPVEDDQQGGAQNAEGADDATLTTDSEAQRDDSVMRPGNEPD
jgi:hypothetical protein